MKSKQRKACETVHPDAAATRNSVTVVNKVGNALKGTGEASEWIALTLSSARTYGDG